MSTISSFKLFVSGICCGIAWHEFTRRVGGRRHMPARNHQWLREQATTAQVEYCRHRRMWLVYRGGTLQGIISSKEQAEQLLEHFGQTDLTCLSLLRCPEQRKYFPLFHWIVNEEWEYSGS